MSYGSIMSSFGEIPGGARPAYSAGGGASGLSGLTGVSSSSLTGALDAARASSSSAFESQLRSAMTAENEEELKGACVQLEEYMLSLLYKQMKATVQRGDLFGQDAGRETYEEWQDEQMIKDIAKNGGIGFGDMMFKQLSRRMQNAYELEGGE